MNVYQMTYDGDSCLVEAESMIAALAKWRAHVAEEGLGDDAIEPERIEALPWDEVIR